MRPRYTSRAMLAVCGLLFALCSPPRAGAVDGVIEINQASAKAGGVVSGDAPFFPVTIGTAGSYRLTSNLDVRDNSARPPGTVPEEMGAIDVTADNVTIDLNGFAILGPVACSFTPPITCSPNEVGFVATGVRAVDIRGTVVMNGTIRGMARDGVALGESSRVEGVTAMANGSSGIVVGNASVVRGCVASYNESVGFSAAGAVIGNSAFNNGAVGLATNSLTGYSHNVFSGNNGGNETDAQVNAFGHELHPGTNVCGLNTTCP